MHKNYLLHILEHVIKNSMNNNFVNLTIGKHTTILETNSNRLMWKLTQRPPYTNHTAKQYMVTMKSKSKVVLFRKYFLIYFCIMSISVSRILSTGKHSLFVLDTSQQLLSVLCYRGTKIFTRTKKDRKMNKNNLSFCYSLFLYLSGAFCAHKGLSCLCHHS